MIRRDVFENKIIKTIKNIFFQHFLSTLLQVMHLYVDSIKGRRLYLIKEKKIINCLKYFVAW